LKNTKYKFIISEIENFVDGLKKIRNIYFQLIFKGEINFDDRNSLISSRNKLNEIEKFDLGILVPICCGHNGALSESEFLCLKYELYKFNFITR
jgi:hypothetical protein